MGLVILDRRQFLQGSLTLVGLSLLPGCGMPPAVAPTAERVRRIGLLNSNTRASAPALETFLEGLRERGWIEGQNLTIGWREAQGRQDRYPALAAELVGLPVEVIVAQSSGLVEAARAATAAIPIVALALPADPVGLGWATSLAHPGGNVTGTVVHRELEGKRVELLKALVPGLTRVGILWAGRPDASVPQGVGWIEAAAQALGLQTVSLETPTQAPDIDAASAEAATHHVEALVVYQSVQISPHRARIIELAARARLPAMYPSRSFVADGGLMSYAPNFLDLYRRTARHVDEILRGTKPADLPIEQPHSFDLMINLKTAQALGLTIPQTVMQQATEIIP